MKRWYFPMVDKIIIPGGGMFSNQLFSVRLPQDLGAPVPRHSKPILIILTPGLKHLLPHALYTLRTSLKRKTAVHLLISTHDPEYFGILRRPCTAALNFSRELRVLKIYSANAAWHKKMNKNRGHCVFSNCTGGGLSVLSSYNRVIKWVAWVDKRRQDLPVFSRPTQSAIEYETRLPPCAKKTTLYMSSVV